MRKYIFILNVLDIMAGLMKGKRFEGVLYMDKNTGLLTFKPYNRKAPKRSRDVLVAKLPWGWVKESACRTNQFAIQEAFIHIISFGQIEDKGILLVSTLKHTFGDIHMITIPAV